jgi:hypothetical protein
VTDPLRPFAQIVRALWTSAASRTRHKRSAAPAPSSETHPRAGESLQAKLVERIASVERDDVGRMRETFVETVLLWELGDHLAQDPAFNELVHRVSAQLAMDPAVGSRLQALLLQLRPPDHSRE